MFNTQLQVCGPAQTADTISTTRTNRIPATATNFRERRNSSKKNPIHFNGAETYQTKAKD